MAVIVGMEGPPMATKIAVDGPGQLLAMCVGLIAV